MVTSNSYEIGKTQGFQPGSYNKIFILAQSLKNLPFLVSGGTFCLPYLTYNEIKNNSSDIALSCYSDLHLIHISNSKCTDRY